LDAGVDGSFYWYVNNWHYINGWEHLRNKLTLGKLPDEVLNQMQDLNRTDFSKSDAVIGRTISILIKLGWSEEEVKSRAEKTKVAIESVL